MEYEWDEAKRLANLDKHGLDFNDAPKVYNAHRTLRIKSPRSGEDRTITVASVRIGSASLTLAVVTVPRGDNVRVISLRRADDRERRALMRALT